MTIEPLGVCPRPGCNASISAYVTPDAASIIDHVCIDDVEEEGE